MRISKSTQLMSMFFVIGVLTFALPMNVLALKPGTDFSGMHFNLNIHGVPDAKSVPSDSGEGRHSIFVPLNDTYELYIAVEGKQWLVTDCDATDADGDVNIILPREIWNDTNGNGILGDPGDTKIGRVKYYKVYVVGLGKPTDEKVIIDPEAVITNSSSILFNLEELIVPGHGSGKNGKGGGKPNWQNATELFFVDVTFLNGTEVYDAWVFDLLELENYWWDVSNSGVKLMKVRFYPVLGNGNG